MLKWNNKKSVNFHADISWAGVYFTLWTHQIDFNSYMCLEGGTTAIHKISDKENWTLLAYVNMQKLWITDRHMRLLTAH